MASVDGVGERRPRRGVRITVSVVVAALVAGAVAWQVAARTTVVEPGSFSNSGAGATLPDCVPSDDIWSMFGNDEDVVVLQTVRNSSPWPVTVISTDPKAYRFEPMADDLREDFTFVKSPGDGAPDATETSDRVTIPPDREAAMWIINPQGDAPRDDDGWSMFGGAPVKLRALGVEREFYLPFRGTVTVGGTEATAARLDRALQEACES